MHNKLIISSEYLDLKNHPVVLRLSEVDLQKSEASWEIHDLSERLISYVDDEFIKGNDIRYLLTDLLMLVSPVFKACCRFKDVGIRNSYTERNLELLTLTVMILKMSSMSYPLKKSA
jgi:hypothetical protein